MGTIEIRIRSIIWLTTSALVGIAATLIVTSAWQAAAAPGDTDSTFVPTGGCRLVDTRPATNVGPRSTPLGPGDIYEVDVRGANGECAGPLAIPTDAVGVALNVTAVNATAASNLRIYPANLTDVPLLSNLNVTPGGPPTPNKVDVQLSPDGAIKVYNFQGSTDVIFDVVGYYTNASLTDINSRLSALEASDSSQSDAIDALSASQPFTVVSEPISDVTAQSSPTEIRRVTLTAPVDGHVATMATGYMLETVDGEIVKCGVMDSISGPPAQEERFWQAPTGGDYAHLSASRVFDIAAGETGTYYLVCANISAGRTSIGAPRLTAIFTPAP